MACFAFCSTVLLLFVATNVHGRSLNSKLGESNFISDGLDIDVHNQSIFLSLPQEILSKDACVHVYGFLPCADNARGYGFQVIVFISLLIAGDYLLFEGSRKLFDIFGLGIYGGFLMQLLLMFPRIALMLSNGFSASQEIAQSMVLGSIGFACGYTVFGLTLQWGFCIIFSCINISNNDSNPKTTTRERSIPMLLSSMATKLKGINTHSSIKPDDDSRQAARIMLLSFLPFMMVQLSEASNSLSWSHSVVVITLIVSVLAVLSYFVYQFYELSERNRYLEQAVSRFWSHMQSFLPKLHLQDTKTIMEVLESRFAEYDSNNDGRIQVDEIKNVIGMETDEAAKEFMKACDINHDGTLDKQEFLEGLRKLLENNHFTVPTRSFVEKLILVDTIEAAIQVITGALIVIFLARPMMMNIELLSLSAGIPSYFIMFVMIPLARNLKQTLSSRVRHRKRPQKEASLKVSQIYGDVTMNNILSMAMILAIVCVRGLTWDYSVEVIIMLVMGLMIGVPAVSNSTYSFWNGIFALSLYPFSLLLIYLRFYVLDSE